MSVRCMGTDASYLSPGTGVDQSYIANAGLHAQKGSHCRRDGEQGFFAQGVVCESYLVTQSFFEREDPAAERADFFAHLRYQW